MMLRVSVVMDMTLPLSAWIQGRDLVSRLPVFLCPRGSFLPFLFFLFVFWFCRVVHLWSQVVSDRPTHHRRSLP